MYKTYNILEQFLTLAICLVQQAGHGRFDMPYLHGFLARCTCSWRGDAIPNTGNRVGIILSGP